MQKILALIDKLTEKIPPSVMRMIRLGSLLTWAVVGTVVVFFSWKSGQDATPPQGQDLSIATIRERVQKEANRRMGGDVTVPDLNSFFPDAVSPDLPSHSDKKPRPGLSGVDDRLIEPENVIQRPDSLPPFLGEDARSETPLHLPDTRDRRPARGDSDRLLEFRDLSGETRAEERRERSDKTSNEESRTERSRVQPDRSDRTMDRKSGREERLDRARDRVESMKTSPGDGKTESTFPRRRERPKAEMAPVE
ncbi:MAG: hypothetical protein JNM27_22925 [Leptospirales bacterium]|nr:hypothetical protein [Leptospirales bacterium]